MRRADTLARRVVLPRAVWHAIERFAADELPGASVDDVLRIALGQLIDDPTQRSNVRRAHDDERRAARAR